MRGGEQRDDDSGDSIELVRHCLTLEVAVSPELVDDEDDDETGRQQGHDRFDVEQRVLVSFRRHKESCHAPHGGEADRQRVSWHQGWLARVFEGQQHKNECDEAMPTTIQNKGARRVTRPAGHNESQATLRRCTCS